MKTLVLILILPTLLFAQVDYNLPEGLELVKVDGNLVTVRDIYTGIEDTYLIEGTPVINGWELEPQQDSLIFELVADLDMYLTEDLQSHDFEYDGLIELVGCDLIDQSDLKFLQNDGIFNFTEVFRIGDDNILYDLGDADEDGFIEVLTQHRSTFRIYEQSLSSGFPDTLVWHITPLGGAYRVWPKYTDLDGDNLSEVSHNNHTSTYYYIAVNENTGQNEYDNFFEIPWPYGSPGDFAWGDFDNDGFIEIAGGSGAGMLSVFENVANDSFELVWQEPFGHHNLKMHEYLGDVDGDGFNEWVSGSHDFTAGGFFFKVFEAVGDNQYEVIYYDSLPGNPWFLGGVSSGDVDGDGINEFVFSSNANVGLYKHYEDTGWQRVWLVENLQGTVIPYLVDTNGDGMCEVIFSPGQIYKLISTIIEEKYAINKSNIRIYPNPANNCMVIEFNIHSSDHFFIDIFDISGKNIYSEHVLSIKSRYLWDLTDKNGKEVSSGIYFLKISSTYYSDVKKITILR